MRASAEGHLKGLTDSPFPQSPLLEKDRGQEPVGWEPWGAQELEVLGSKEQERAALHHIALRQRGLHPKGKTACPRSPSP